MGKLFDELKKSSSIKDLTSGKDNPPSRSEMIMKYLKGWICNEPESPAAPFTREEILSCIDRQIGHIRFLNGAQVGDRITKTEYGFSNISQLKRVAKRSTNEEKKISNE